nr:stalk domain-containing protein [Paenibacillus caui]
MGDSLTAGYEPDLATQPAPVPYGFADRIKEQGLYHGRTELANYGILGLKSEGLAHYVSAIQEGRQPAPDEIQVGLSDPRIAQFAAGTTQAKADIEAANLITITIGGNDVKSLLQEAGKLADSDLEAKLKTLIDAYTANLTQALTNLRTMNPQALIVVADQYQPVPELVGAASYAKLEKAAGAFTEATDAVVAGFAGQTGQVKVAHVAAAFVGNELSFTHILEGDIHPKQAGYEAIAKVFSEVIWGDYRQTRAALGQEAISIVVGGQELLTPNKPILKNGQTFIAIGDIIQATHAVSNWDSRNGSLSLTYQGNKVVIPIGSKTIQVNGEKVSTAAPAFLQKAGSNSKTYVPLALLAKGLGFDVQYSSKVKTVFINL